MNPKASREIVWLFVVTLAVLLPLGYFMGRHRLPVSMATVSPDSPWRLTDNRYRQSQIALAPRGDYLAGICPSPLPTPVGSGLRWPGSTSANQPDFTTNQNNDLVIWRVADRSEVARLSVGSGEGALRWHPNGQLSLSADKKFTLFDWKVGSVIVSSSIGDRIRDNIDNHHVAQKRFDIASDVELAAINGFSRSGPDKDYLEAVRISSGAPIPVRQNAAVKFEYLSGQQIDLAIRPALPGSPVQATILQAEPTPTPKPTATPVPTATPTREQREFLQKEERINKEVEDKANRLMGEDPPTGREAAEMEARVKTLIAEANAERARLFPPPHTASQREDVPRWMKVLQWDGATGRILWQKRFRQGVFGPYASWSPNGKILALIGTGRPVQFSNGVFWEGRGIDFLDGRTGRLIGSATLSDDVKWDILDEIHWLPESRLVIKDSNSAFRPQLRFLNATNGRTVRLWPLQNIFESSNQIDSYSTDATGSTWAFASGQRGWRVVAPPPTSSTEAATSSR